MQYWNNIVLEGHCLSQTCCPPCGNKYPSSFCLGDHTKCPYFGWAESTERGAAKFVPLRLVLKDRLAGSMDASWWWIRWQVWDRWFFKRHKFGDIKIHKTTAEEKEVENKIREEFKEWFNKEDKKIGT